MRRCGGGGITKPTFQLGMKTDGFKTAFNKLALLCDDKIKASEFQLLLLTPEQDKRSVFNFGGKTISHPKFCFSMRQLSFSKKKIIAKKKKKRPLHPSYRLWKVVESVKLKRCLKPVCKRRKGLVCPPVLEGRTGSH